MFTRMTNCATIARVRAVTSKVIPRLQADTTVLARVWRTLVQHLTRINQDIHTRDQIQDVRLGTVVLGANVLWQNLPTIIELQASEATNEALDHHLS